MPSNGNMWSKEGFPRRVRLRDMTMRDGLQSLPTVLPTSVKLEMYSVLISAGICDLQVTSFMNPARLPQLADAEAFYAAIAKGPERKSVLVANLRGCTRALAAGATEIEAVVSASGTYNSKNAHRTTEQSVEEIVQMVRPCQQAGCRLTVAIANCFHCVFEKWIEAGKVTELVDRLIKEGIEEIELCDTTGFATPDRIYGLFDQVRREFPQGIFGSHLHDTRGRGLVNAIASLSAGIDWLDVSLAGLGGTPFAPGMGGNLSLELVVDTLNEMGVETGIDTDAAFKAGARVRELIA